jgi:hypothetical protein
MLFDGATWYASVPGVVETGPYNPHFVQDIGAAFLVAGLALAARPGDRSIGPQPSPVRDSWPLTP